MFIRVVQPLNRLIFAAMNTMISIAPQDLSAHIYLIRGRNVLLDDYLAKLYGVSTKSLNQAVKRNPDRFPPDFMFQLSDNEWINLRSQNVTSNEIKEQGGRRYMPYAFTEQGVAMLSGILNSDKAINMNIAIMRAFVEVRRILLQQSDLKTQLKEIKERLGEHDVQLNQIYDAMENLLDEKTAQRKWEDRERIGFKK